MSPTYSQLFKRRLISGLTLEYDRKGPIHAEHVTTQNRVQNHRLVVAKYLWVLLSRLGFIEILLRELPGPPEFDVIDVDEDAMACFTLGATTGVYVGSDVRHCIPFTVA